MADYAPLVVPYGHEQEAEPSQTPKSFGIEAHFADSKLVPHRPQSGHDEEPLTIAVGEQGKMDVK